MKEVRVNVRLDKPLGDKIREDAARDVTTLSAVIRRIVAQHYGYKAPISPDSQGHY